MVYFVTDSLLLFVVFVSVLHYWAKRLAGKNVSEMSINLEFLSLGQISPKVTFGKTEAGLSLNGLCSREPSHNVKALAVERFKNLMTSCSAISAVNFSSVYMRWLHADKGWANWSCSFLRSMPSMATAINSVLLMLSGLAKLFSTLWFVVSNSLLQHLVAVVMGLQCVKCFKLPWRSFYSVKPAKFYTSETVAFVGLDFFISLHMNWR